jgi:hypothetical protein
MFMHALTGLNVPQIHVTPAFTSDQQTRLPWHRDRIHKKAVRRERAQYLTSEQMAHLGIRHEQIANDGEVMTANHTRHCEVTHTCIKRTVTYTLTAQWARTNVGRSLRPTHLYGKEQMEMAVRMIPVRLDHNRGRR